MVIRYSIFVIIIYFNLTSVHAQDWRVAGVDDALKMAQGMAFDGKRSEAREVLNFILATHPDYHDARILLARTYAWDKLRQSARLELQAVLLKDPGNEDAIRALVDVDIWDDQYANALVTVMKGLEFYPDDEDFLYRKASVLMDLHAFDEALLAVKELLMLYPNDARGIQLYKDILSANMKYTLGVSYGLDLFSRTYAPANYASVQLSRINKWGSSIVTLNYSARFSSTGIQPEVDLYPKIADGVYAYLNYGYSPSTLFPRHRMGGEIYTRLPKRLEASGGVRYLYFGPDSKVLIYTGSLGWYINNLWLSYRPYVTPDRSGTSFSSTLLVRKYFSDGNNYLGFKGGFGFSPDEARIQSGAGLSVDGIYVLKSQHIGITWQKSFSNNFTLNANYTLTHQELSFELGEYVWVNGVYIALRRKF